MSDTEDILEACRLYKEAEENLETQRENLGWALVKARRSLNVSDLARLTEIKRPSIYWLMKKVTTNTNGNQGNSNGRAQ